MGHGKSSGSMFIKKHTINENLMGIKINSKNIPQVKDDLKENGQ